MNKYIKFEELNYAGKTHWIFDTVDDVIGGLHSFKEEISDEFKEEIRRFIEQLRKEEYNEIVFNITGNDCTMGRENATTYDLYKVRLTIFEMTEEEYKKLEETDCIF